MTPARAQTRTSLLDLEFSARTYYIASYIFVHTYVTLDVFVDYVMNTVKSTFISS